MTMRLVILMPLMLIATSCAPDSSAVEQRVDEDIIIDIPPTTEQADGELILQKATTNVTRDGITCDWDRCGDSGGYVCTGDNGSGICLWQRGTWYFQCSTSYCLQGGTSCYRCDRSEY